MPTPTFWTEPDGRTRRSLRRYVRTDHTGWTCAAGWHDAMVWMDDVPADGASGDNWPHDDPRWPTSCDRGCGYEFTDDDHWQLFNQALYTRPGHDDAWPLRDLPHGAMYDLTWLPDVFGRGPDGIALAVVLPPDGHVWHVDSEASNCTRKGDRTHRCWIRHGDPRTGQVHVDKDGDTCDAGGGSIATPRYHGFLHHGVLTDG